METAPGVRVDSGARHPPSTLLTVRQPWAKCSTFHPIPAASVRCRHGYHAHFTDEETEAQRDETPSKWQNQNLNSSQPDPKVEAEPQIATVSSVPALALLRLALPSLCTCYLSLHPLSVASSVESSWP